MTEMSISELSVLTGFTRETVAKRLQDAPFTTVGVARRFDSKLALPALYEAPAGGGNAQTNLMVERAKLAATQRQKLELEIGVMQSRLLEAGVVEATWSNLTSAARQRLLAIPYRIAMAAQSADGNFARIESAAAELVREALEELHAYDVADYTPAGKWPK